MASVSSLHIEDRYIMVAALDVGTSCSGYAFSYKTSKNDIRMNKNWGTGFLSYKTPTCVLTKAGPTGSYVDFGYEAETSYFTSIVGKNPKMYDLYHNFKMDLYNVKKLTDKLKVKSTSGTERPLIDIFEMMIKALKDHLMDAIKTSGVSTLTESEVRWVITLPAIWHDNAKQFMKQAATKAGLTKENVLLSLEPEVATLHCRNLGINNFHRANEFFQNKDIQFSAGMKYLLLDAGGGTVDITAHEILEDNNVRELHSSTGGGWGGNRVNDNFINLTKNAMGVEFVEKFRKECPQQWYTFMTKFEMQKKEANPSKRSIHVELSCNMDRKYKEWYNNADLEKKINDTGIVGVSASNGILVLSQEKTTELFSPVIEQIKTHIDALLKSKELEHYKINFLFLVGGFGSSAYLQNVLQDYFRKANIPVLIPEEAQLAVVQGAVQYGYNPSAFQRKAQLTYGISTILPFDEAKHNPNKKCKGDGGVEYCCDVFQPFINKGELIEPGIVGKMCVTPLMSGSSVVTLTFHTLDRKPSKSKVTYIDSNGVKKVGTITVDMPTISKGGSHKDTELEVFFDDVEIKVKAIGSNAKAHIDFMSV